MTQSGGFDAEQLRARIHENVVARRKGFDRAAPAGDPVTPDAVDPDLALLRTSADVASIPLGSHRSLLGPAVTFVKGVLVKLLAPVLARQTAFNGAGARLLDATRREHAHTVARLEEVIARQHAELLGRVDALTQRQAQAQAQAQAQTDLLARRQSATNEQLGVLHRHHGKIDDALTALGQAEEALTRRQAALHTEVHETHARALETTREHLVRAERKLRRIVHVLTAGATDPPPAASTPRSLSPRLLEPEFDYAGFEERFRGSEELVKARQGPHLEPFRGRDNVLEIGCGRGEFLELLRGAGVAARGVDTDLDMILACREKGLDVVQEDVFDHLESLPDDSLGGVFSAQMIEHLETPQLKRLVRLCHRKLRPGGVLVLETLNPECLLVLYRWFWIDLTHVRLVHPETLRFLVESVGFREVERHFLPSGDTPLIIPPLEIGGQHVPELTRFNAATDHLNKLLYASSDYTVTGTK